MKKAISLILFTLLIVGSPGFSSASALEYRTIDGSGNNVNNPNWGQAVQPLLRKTIQAYDDGLSAPRGGDSSLPSARSVSNAVVSQPIGIEPDGASDMLWLWGQFLDHDMDLTTSASPAESFDIAVPSGDPFFDPQNSGTQIIPLSRSIYQNDNNGVRQQLNQITAYIDASMVYGSDQSRSDALRTLDGTGKLIVSQGDLLPFNTMGFANAGGTGSNLFLAGDIRANEQISLTVMHTLFVREHNRLADEIKMRLDSGEPLITQAFTDSGIATEDEFIFQTARTVVGAEIQQITYNEFLPMLLGQNALLSYSGYSDTLNAQVANEFSTAAFRVGHTMLSSTLQRINEDGTSNNPLPLQNAFFSPSIIQNEGIDNILRGFASGHSQRVDTFIVDDVRNFLFGPPGSGGFDLASLNIQRGRDHGIPSLNDVRSSLSLTPWATFSEMTGGDSNLAAALDSVYDNVDDVDLWVGGLAEPHVNGGKVGETFFVIIADQLQRLRDGDRFFYLEPSMQAQLSVFDPNLQGRRLSEIILLNTDIESIQQNVFLAVPRLPSDLDDDGIPDTTDTDDDGDGIPDPLDTLPTMFSDAFSDGTTFGNIESRGGKTVTISDLANPDGINVLAVGGGAPATVSSCGFAGIISFASGDSADIRCGSVTISIVTGSVVITFDMGDGLMTTTLTGGSITFDPNSDFLGVETGPGTTGTIEIDGVVTPLEENQEMMFDMTQPNNSQVIGGELLPINSVALLIAGIQSTSWLVPVFASVGLGIYVIKRK